MLNMLYPWFLLFFMGTTWGLSFALMRLAVESGGMALGVALWQVVVTFSCLWLVLLWQCENKTVEKKEIKHIIVLSLLGTVIPGATLYFAAEHVPSGVLAITATMVPIFTYVMALFLGMELIHGSRLVGVLLGFLAVLFLVLPDNSLPAPEAVPWVLLACMSTWCFALENIYLARVSMLCVSPIQLVCYMNACATVFLAPLAYFMGHVFMPKFPFSALEWSVLGMGLITAVIYSLYVFTIKHYGPVFASQMGYVVTLSGVFWGILIFGEWHSTWVWISLALMLCGLSLVSPSEKKT